MKSPTNLRWWKIEGISPAHAALYPLDETLTVYLCGLRLTMKRGFAIMDTKRRVRKCKKCLRSSLRARA